jgi:hypothetical protein
MLAVGAAGCGPTVGSGASAEASVCEVTAPSWAALECPDGTTPFHQTVRSNRPWTRFDPVPPPTRRETREGTVCAGQFGGRDDATEQQVLGACGSGGRTFGPVEPSPHARVSWQCFLPDGTMHGPYAEAPAPRETFTVTGQFDRGRRVGRWQAWSPEGRYLGSETFNAGTSRSLDDCR